MIYGKYKFEFPFLWLSNINKSTSGGKIYFILQLVIDHPENSRKKHKASNGGNSWCRGHGGVLITGLCLMAFSALYHIKARDSSAGVAPPTVTCTLISGIKKKMMQYRLDCWSILQRNFRYWYSLFQNISILCTVKIKLVSSSLKA